MKSDLVSHVAVLYCESHCLGWKIHLRSGFKSKDGKGYLLCYDLTHASKELSQLSYSSRDNTSVEEANYRERMGCYQKR